jgi:hypothetical protein
MHYKHNIMATSFFDEIKNTILTIPSESPVFLYVGVGTAAGMMNAGGTLFAQHYHQFPPFIQNLKNNFPQMHIILALIDPCQENPPYVVLDHRLLNKSTPDQYTNLNGTLQVHVLREAVYTEPYLPIPAEAVNITRELQQLNAFVIQHRVSMLYHDFTGRAVRLLAEYFDDTLRHHLDQVIYGMSARTEHGCYFDLTRENAFFALKLEGQFPPPPEQGQAQAQQAQAQQAQEFLQLFQPRQPNVDNHARPMVRMFNYYKFIVTNTLPDAKREIAQYPPAVSTNLIKPQLNEIMYIYMTRFKHMQLTMLRQVRNALIQPDSEFALNLHKAADILNDIPLLQRAPFLELLQEKEFKALYDLLFEYVANHLNVFAQMTEMDISGSEILTFITADADTYKWYNNIVLFM